MVEQNTAAVVIVTDSDLLFAALPLLREVAVGVRGRADVHCLFSGLTARQEAALDAIDNVQPSPLTAAGLPSGPVMIGADPAKAPLYYGRFQIWSERFDRYDTVVYLDADMIVLSNLEDLLESDWYIAADVGDAPIVGCTPRANESGSPDDLDRLLAEDGLSQLTTGGVEPANAGVIAIGRRYRSAQDRARLTHLVQRYGRFLLWADQSVINLWMLEKGARPSTDNRFNCQVRGTVGRPGGLAEILDAEVLHFTGMGPGTRRLAISNARFWLRMPRGGRHCFYFTHWALFDGHRLRALPQLLVDIRRLLRRQSDRTSGPSANRQALPPG